MAQAAWAMCVHNFPILVFPRMADAFPLAHRRRTQESATFRRAHAPTRTRRSGALTQPPAAEAGGRIGQRGLRHRIPPVGALSGRNLAACTQGASRPRPSSATRPLQRPRVAAGQWQRPAPPQHRRRAIPSGPMDPRAPSAAAIVDEATPARLTQGHRVMIFPAWRYNTCGPTRGDPCCARMV